MPRRVLALLLAAALTLGLCGCADVGYPYYNMKRVGVENYALKYPKDLEQLSQRDVIIRGTPKKSVKSNPDTLETLVPIIAKKVFQDNYSGFWGHLEDGDMLKLEEPYIVKGDWFGKELVASDGIMPSKVGVEYLYFLNCSAPLDDPFFYVDGPFCRYPWMDARGLSTEEISDRVDGMTYQKLYVRPGLSPAEDQIYRELYKEVIQTYMQ